MSIFVAIVGLAVLVLLHEAGHFFVARAVGMNPRRFYLGFPPALVKTTRNGIEYGIGAIPLGGYVRIPGMHRPAASDLDVQLGPAVKEDPSLFPKVARVRRGLESGDLDGARESLPALGVAVDEANSLSPAAAKAAQRGVTEIDEGLSSDAYWRQRTWKRVAVIFAGPGVNIVLAILLVALAYWIGAPGDASRSVKSVKSGTPAESIGLHQGDVVIAIDGRPTPDFNTVSARIRASDGNPIMVTVVRNDEVKILGPVKTKRIGDRWALGFEPGWQELKYGPLGAFGRSFSDNWQATKSIVTFFPRLVTGSGRKEVSSPVGIVDVSKQAVELNFPLYLIILGLISLSLAILNLLPLLPLDGGHILFSLIEGIRGRAVGREIYERVSAVGIALFLVLMFIGLSNDINRLGGG
jgi:regulator of sigma E protease